MDSLEYSFVYLSEEDKEKVDDDVERFHMRKGIPSSSFTGKEVVYTHPSLLRLLVKVARKHPTWGFSSVGMRYAPEPKAFTTPIGIVEIPQLSIYKVTVYARSGKEKIGTIGLEGTSRFKLDSPPLQRERVRGHMTYTKDIDKAARIINKSFYPLTLKERINDRNYELRQKLRDSASAKEGTYNGQWRGIRQHLRTHIEENWETFAPICVAAGMDKGVASTFLQAKHEAHILNKLHTGGGVASEHVFVCLEDDLYMVRKKGLGDTSIEQYTTYDLPAKYKQKIGLLKLVDDEHAIADVGYRLRANSFLIFEEE